MPARWEARQRSWAAQTACWYTSGRWRWPHRAILGYSIASGPAPLSATLPWGQLPLTCLLRRFSYFASCPGLLTCPAPYLILPVLPAVIASSLLWLMDRITHPAAQGSIPRKLPTCFAAYWAGLRYIWCILCLQCKPLEQTKAQHQELWRNNSTTSTNEDAILINLPHFIPCLPKDKSTFIRMFSC